MTKEDYIKLDNDIKNKFNCFMYLVLSKSFYKRNTIMSLYPITYTTSSG